MKKNIFVSLIISVLSLSLLLVLVNFLNTLTPISPDKRFTYIKYMDAEDLIATSDLVINGTIKSQSLMTLNINLDPSGAPLYIDYIVADVLITDIIHGDKQIGDVIQVKYPTSDTLEHYKKCDSDFSINNDVILFLKEYKNFPYSIVSPHQGIINLSCQSTDDTLSLKDQYTIYQLFSYNSKEELINALKSFY